MWHNDYIDSEFTSYVNRHCNGIVQLKDKIEKISVYFGLAEAFSNHACRFYIDVDFIDYKSFSAEDKRNANQFFYNSQNATGSKFVSFIYKSQRDYHIDIEVVKSFIYHYQFAQHIFEGFIKNILPPDCVLKITPLEQEPFFNYISHFLRLSRYSNEDNKLPFKKEYLKVTNREFDFDRHYHKDLINAAVKELTSRENVVTDEELHNAGGGNVSDIRRFVLENDIPFSVGYYTDVIDNIQIDISTLKEKTINHIADSYSTINSAVILSLIKNKENTVIKKEMIIREKREALAIQLGDYIYVENSYPNADSDILGIIKSMDLNYSNELEIQYITLNKDLSESRLSLKSTKNNEIIYTLKAEIFQEEKDKGLLQNKNQLIQLFKNKGRKNPAFKTKRRKK